VGSVAGSRDIGLWPPGMLAFGIRNGSISTFPVQIRLVYLGVTLQGLWEAPRVYVFVLLLAGTFVVAAFGRCGIALVLKPMPWNRDRELQGN